MCLHLGELVSCKPERGKQGFMASDSGLSSSGENFSELGMLAMMSRKAEEELLRAGSIGEVGSAYVEDSHFGSSQRLSLFLT